MTIDWAAPIENLGSRYRYITDGYRVVNEQFRQGKGNGQFLEWGRINQERWKRNWSLLLKLRWPKYQWAQVYPIPKDQNP